MYTVKVDIVGFDAPVFVGVMDANNHVEALGGALAILLEKGDLKVTHIEVFDGNQIPAYAKRAHNLRQLRSFKQPAPAAKPAKAVAAKPAAKRPLRVTKSRRKARKAS